MNAEKGLKTVIPVPTADHATTDAASFNALPAASSCSPPPHMATPGPNPPITANLIQQMIMNAFSALGVSGTHHHLSSPWYLDSSASNHMTFSSGLLSNTRKYTGNLQVHTTTGEKAHNSFC